MNPNNAVVSKSAATVERLISKLEEIQSYLQDNEELNQSGIQSSFRQTLRRTKDNQDTMDQKRVLRIAIVGPMKAGKSSFLNAVLFDSERILPEAATPMTAALTHISYGEKNHAEVEFYTKEDWEAINQEENDFQRLVDEVFKENQKRYEQQCKSCDPSMGYLPPPPTKEEAETVAKGRCGAAVLACHEQWEASEQEMRLKTEGEACAMLESAAVSGLLGKLKQYVGADGEYVQYVKCVRLYINDPRLEDLEITDTPGLYDPITSRSQRTQEYVKASDAVLFLTSSDKPLSESEVRFLKNAVPQDKYADTYIICTKLDLLMLQRSVRKSGRFQNDFKNAWGTNQKSSRDALSKNGVQIPDGQIVPVSSWLYEVGRRMRKGEEIPKEIWEAMGKIQTAFPDFPAKQAEELIKISRVSIIRELLFPEYRKKKEELLQKTASDYVRARCSEAVEAMGLIINDTESRYNDLVEHDQASLQQRMKGMESAINGMRGEISACFSECARETERNVAMLIAEIGEGSKEFDDIEQETKTERETRTERSGLFGWVKTEYEADVKYHVGKLSSAAKMIKDFSVFCARMIAERYEKCMDTKKLKGVIRDILDKHMKYSGVADVSSSDLLMTITQELSDLGGIDPASLNTQEYIEKLEKEFPNTNTKIMPDELREALVKLLMDIMERVKEVLTEYQKRDCNQLRELSATFVDSFQKDIEEDMEKTKKMMEDKEASVLLLQSHKEKLKQFISQLQELR